MTDSPDITRPTPSPGRPERRSVTSVATELRFDRWYLPLAAAVGLGPKSTELWVEGSTLHVKMGWAFTADIPVTSIKTAEPSNERVFTAGVHVMGSRWLVNGSRKGLVQLTLDPGTGQSLVQGDHLESVVAQRHRPRRAHRGLHRGGSIAAAPQCLVRNQSR